MEKTIYKPYEAAKFLNITTQTLRNWEKRGLLIAKRTPTNRRYYTKDQLLKILNK